MTEIEFYVFVGTALFGVWLGWVAFHGMEDW